MKQWNKYSADHNFAPIKKKIRNVQELAIMILVLMMLLHDHLGGA